MFTFNLNQEVVIKVSGERGRVEGRAEYVSDGDGYYIHYRAADGRSASRWFAEHQLDSVKSSITEGLAGE